MADRSGLDRERDAVRGCVDQTERRRELLVVGRMGGVQRDGPAEDRFGRRDPVGDRRTGKTVTGEVLVGIDEAGHDEPSGTAEPGGRNAIVGALRQRDRRRQFARECTATAPSRIIVRDGSIVRIQSPSTMRSAAAASPSDAADIAVSYGEPTSRRIPSCSSTPQRCAATGTWSPSQQRSTIARTPPVCWAMTS